MKEVFAISMEDVACVHLYVLKGFNAIIDEISWTIRADGTIKLEYISIDNIGNTI